MNALVDDLLDFTRSRLGGGIPIAPADMDIAKIGRHAVDELAALYPDRVVNLQSPGELWGIWDGPRLAQALSNLVSNAVEHGSDDTPINVELRAVTDGVALAVQNRGPVIPDDQLHKIFDPMHRIDSGDPALPRRNLGLGLYITERIVAAHGGRLTVESSEEKGTTFTIHLPKDSPTAVDAFAARDSRATAAK
jgi:signal transduction histidine kinase